MKPFGYPDNRASSTSAAYVARHFHVHRRRQLHGVLNKFLQNSTVLATPLLHEYPDTSNVEGGKKHGERQVQRDIIKK